ncbi:MAG TPA: SDR family NAD(P)-dependent oxidoreductase [Candidatus Acidoferrales bacterium]|nr:SDR family NAD(P)-dependent oxidoreductase [Candidatus Acidoferrales bacterium]
MANVLITGCRRGGIGLEVGCKLLKRRHKVYATVQFENSVDDVRTVLKPYGENFVVEKLDITDTNDLVKVDDWNVDVLIHNAALGDSGPLAEIPPERIRATFETNVVSALRLTQRVLPKMIAKGDGRIVFMGSMGGLIPTPFYAPYNVTKFALECIAFNLRTELKPFGIKVVMINPGATDTGFDKRNFDRKYEWMNVNGLYKDHMGYIRKYDERPLKYSQKISNVSKIVVKAVEARHPRRRYVAPLYQWIMLPMMRRFG